MAEGRDPKIVIRTEYDPKGIQKLLADAQQVARQLGAIQQASVKAAERAQAAAIRLQVNSGKMSARATLKEFNDKVRAEQQALKVKEQADAQKARIDAGETRRKAAEAARQNAIEQRKLNADVKAVEKAEDAKFKIRLANEEKIRSGLNFMRDEGPAVYNKAIGTSTGIGPNLLASLGSVLSPGGFLGKIGAAIGGGLLNAANAFKNAMGAAIEWIGRSIQISIGIMLRDIALWFVRTLHQGINTAIQSVAGVERLFISLTTQGQMENQSNGMEAAEALSKARQEAGRYLQIVRELAIYSPFSVEDVQNIYRTYAAYGLTRGEAIKLTEGMIDLSSAFAVSGAEAQRASLAVAQIIARGRATGEEIRQLVNSGLPLMSKLADKLGVTKQEFSNMAKEGKLTTEILLPALRELFAEFEGAGARASMTTFTGLLSSLGDIGPMILQEFFGPINQATGEMEGLFGALIPKLRQIVDFFTSPRTLGTIREWGKQLGDAATAAFDWAEKGFAWGYNLMVQYGNGIIAAGREVLRALANIGRMIMKFLKPNSPPLILPDIDKWGKETMEQWLQGFTQADANSVFSTLSGELGSLMKGLMAQVEDETVLPKMLMGLNEGLGDLIQAYSSGNGLAEAQSRITSMFGAAAPVVQNYVQALLNAQTASTAVAGAERNLASVTKYYEDVLASLDAQIKALQNTQKDIGDDVEIRKLNLILNSQFTTEDRKAQARARLEELRLTKVKRGIEEERDAKVSAAQAAVDAAKLEQEKRNEQLAAAKAMLDFYQMQNDLLNDSIDAAEDLAKALKEAAGAMGDSLDDLLGLLGGEDPFTGKQKSEKWDIFGPWREEMELFGKDWDKFWEDLNKAVEEFKASYLVDVLFGINPTSVIAADATKRNIDRMIEAWNSLPQSVHNAIFGGALTGMGAGTMSVMSTVLKFDVDLGTALDSALLSIQAFKAGSVIAMTLLSTIMLLISDVITGGVTGKFETMKTKMIEHVQEAKEEIVRIFGAWVVESEEVLGPWYTRMQDLFGNIKNAIVQALQDVVTQGSGYVNDMIGLINGLIAAYNAVPWLPDVANVDFIEVPNFQQGPGTPGKTASTTTNNTSTTTTENTFNVTIKSDRPQQIAANFQRMMTTQAV